MALLGRRDTSNRRGWSLRYYMALFMAVLLALAALAVRTLSETPSPRPA